MVATASVVGHRAHDAWGLVQRQVDQVGAGWDAPAVDPDDLSLRVHSRAEPADDLAVDLDPAGSDQLLAASAAAHARCGEHLLQPDAVRDVDQRVALTWLTPVVVVEVGLASGGCRGAG